MLSSAGRHFTAKFALKFVLGRVKKKLSHLGYQIDNLDGSNAGNWRVNDLKNIMGLILIYLIIVSVISDSV